MTTMVHSVAHDSPRPADTHLCKKCSTSLQEGQAYELGDDRWHLECFVCSKCSNSLGCESNFLVLGNGSLVCSDCSYNCKQCGKKIDDLAILTGDQAYCSGCFQCRLCRKRIEDLRYARTSKGLFCMDCHKKLVDRKKHAKLAQVEDELRDLSLNPDENVKRSSSPLDPGLSYFDTSMTKKNSRTSLISHDDSQATLKMSSARRRDFQTEIKLLPSPPDETLANTSTPNTNSKVNPPSRATSFHAEQTISETTSEPHSPSGENWDVDVSHSSIEEVGVFSDDDDDVPHTTLQKSKMRATTEPNANSTPTTLNGFQDLSSSLQTSQTPSNQTSELESQDYEAYELQSSPFKELAPTDFESPRVQSPYPSLRKDRTSNTTPKVTPRLDVTSEHGKNIMILSPNQFRDNEFHSTVSSPSTMIRSINDVNFGAIKTNPDNIRPKSVALLPEFSPMRRVSAQSPHARANRQARVVETFNYGSNDIADEPIILHSPRQQSPHEDSSSAESSSPVLKTPSLSKSLPLSEDVASRSSTDKFPGLGVGFGDLLDGVDPLDTNTQGIGRRTLRGTQSAPLRTPSTSSRLSKLAWTSDAKPSDSPAPTNPQETSRDFSATRISGMKSGRPVHQRHGRSTSGSSMKSSMLALMQAKKDTDSVLTDAGAHHVRRSSDASTHSDRIMHPGVLAFTTPPLPSGQSPAMGHLRSPSDTPFITSLDARFFDDQGLAVWKQEMENLHIRRQDLESEVKRLENVRALLDKENQLLHEQVSQVRINLEQETLRYEKIALECDDLEQRRSSLQESNQQLMDSNTLISTPLIRDDRHTPSGSHAADAPVSSAFSRLSRSSSSLSIHSTNATSSTDTLNEDPHRDSLRQPRLKFWRRGQKPSANTVNTHGTSSTSGRSGSTNLLQNGILSSTGASHLLPAREASSQKSRSTLFLDSISASFSSNTISESMDDEGVPLLVSSIEDRAKYERAVVPLIISRCIEEVEKRGLAMQGIYRLSGSTLTTAAILNAFANFPPHGDGDERSKAKLDDLIGGDINAVTSALKRYLIHLPEPLITFAVYDAFIAVGALGDTVSRSDRITELREKVLAKMPRANQHATYLLCKHLRTVEKHLSENKMSFKNLSLMFGPTIAREETGCREMLDMGHKADATELMISNFALVFNDE